MESLLVDRFRAEVSKSKDYNMKAESAPDVSYSSGFLGLDFLNGTMVHVKSETKNYKYYSCGLVDGSVVMLIGRSSCGKSTFAVQCAANIIRPFPNGVVFEESVEGGMTEARREILTGFEGDELKRRFICRNSGVTTNNVYERIRMVAEMKTQNRSSFEYDTGLFDSRGNRIFKLEPTVFIIDSLAMLTPNDQYNSEELGTNMSASQNAKANADLFKRIIPLIKPANIIVLVINHIQKKIEINPMARTKAQVAYLKQGETLPGGDRAIYVANNIIRFDDTKLKESESFKIAGAIVELSLLKSRTSVVGKSIQLVFTNDHGFDPVLSLFLLLKNNNRLKGAGAYLKLESLPEVSFSQATFVKKLEESPELLEAFKKECMEELKLLVAPSYEKISSYTDSFSSDIITGINQELIEN